MGQTPLGVRTPRDGICTPLLWSSLWHNRTGLDPDICSESVARFLELFCLKRATFLKKLEGEVRPTGQLTAVRHPSRPAEPLQARVDDAMSESDSAVLARASGSDIDAVRLAGEVRSVAADLLEGGSLSSSIQGQSPRGEEDTQHVCEILIERLNHDVTWIFSIFWPSHALQSMSSSRGLSVGGRLSIQRVPGARALAAVFAGVQGQAWEREGRCNRERGERDACRSAQFESP
jgi:hypothetical protein